jgi:DNA-binding NarL/FixJ family response regulator
MAITIAVADDHRLFLKSLAALIANYPGLSIVAEGVNGNELIDRLGALSFVPDIIIIDVNMPNMDGEATAIHIHQKYPGTKIVALSMRDDDRSIIKMIRAGCCAYLLKDIHPDELEKALHEIHAKGSYNADSVNINYRRLLQYTQQEEALNITEKEMLFLQLACSDQT